MAVNVEYFDKKLNKKLSFFKEVSSLEDVVEIDDALNLSNDISDVNVELLDFK